MTYTFEELPRNVKMALPSEERHIWMERYNRAYQDSGDFETAYKLAWASVIDSPTIRKVQGWMSVDSVDSQRDKVSIDAVMEAMPEFIRDGGPMYFQHKSVEIGTTVDFSRGINPKSGTEGARGVGVVYQGKRIFNDAWKGISSGELAQFSLGGDRLEKSIACDANSCFQLVKKLHIFDLTATPKGSCRYADIDQVNIMAKSDYQDKLKEFMKQPRTAEQVLDACPACRGLYGTLCSEGMSDPMAKSLVLEFAKSQADCGCGAKADPMAKGDVEMQGMINRLLAVVMEMRGKLESFMASQAGTPEGAQGEANNPELDGQAPGAPAGAPKAPGAPPGAPGAPGEAPPKAGALPTDSHPDEADKSKAGAPTVPGAPEAPGAPPGAGNPQGKAPEAPGAPSDDKTEEEKKMEADKMAKADKTPEQLSIEADIARLDKQRQDLVARQDLMAKAGAGFNAPRPPDPGNGMGGPDNSQKLRDPHYLATLKAKDADKILKNGVQ
jgi:cation transport regulator ChaB